MIRISFVCPWLMLCVTILPCCLWQPAEAKTAATFTGIGQVGGASSSYVHGISADGSVVIGYGFGGSVSSERALMWSRGTGMVDLGFPDGFGSSEAWAASANGDVIVGTSREGYGFRWTPTTGMSLVSDSSFLRPMAVSDDGTTIAGGGFYDSVGGWFQAFRLQTATGIVGLGALGGFGESAVYDVSADGSVLVGSSKNYGPEQAFRWTESSGMQALSQDPSQASAVSADGKVIGGKIAFGFDGTPRAAFRWTEQTGITLLHPPTELHEFQHVFGMSSDGSRIVGARDFAAMIWEEESGMRDLHDVLVEEYGLASNLRGWTLGEATAISADGRTIAGNGVNPQGHWEAWVVVLPVPEPQSLAVLALMLVGASGPLQRRFAQQAG